MARIEIAAGWKGGVEVNRSCVELPAGVGRIRNRKIKLRYTHQLHLSAKEHSAIEQDPTQLGQAIADREVVRPEQSSEKSFGLRGKGSTSAATAEAATAQYFLKPTKNPEIGLVKLEEGDLLIDSVIDQI